jgi:hypothetical protein
MQCINCAWREFDRSWGSEVDDGCVSKGGNEMCALWWCRRGLCSGKERGGRIGTCGWDLSSGKDRGVGTGIRGGGGFTLRFFLFLLLLFQSFIHFSSRCDILEQLKDLGAHFRVCRFRISHHLLWHWLGIHIHCILILILGGFFVIPAVTAYGTQRRLPLLLTLLMLLVNRNSIRIRIIHTLIAIFPII